MILVFPDPTHLILCKQSFILDLIVSIPYLCTLTYLIYILDCSTPTADTGYVVGSYPSTTYGSNSGMTCDTGYEGTAADITCTAEGNWTTQTGCTIVGKYWWQASQW